MVMMLDGMVALSNPYCNAWIGDRRTGNKATGWQIDSLSLSSAGDINSEYMNRFLISPIRPTQIRPVSDFLTKPQPVMMISSSRCSVSPSSAPSIEPRTLRRDGS